MNRFFIKTKNLVLSKQKTIISSALIVSSTIILSRLFGFLRYRTLSGYFTKGELDIFFASFRIPDVIFEIFITGALTSSFVPIFIKYQESKEKLKENISSIINIITLISLVFVLILFIFADKLIPLITPGFAGDKINQVIYYSRILLVGQLPFLVMGGFLTGIGQANKTFIIASLAPVLYNLAIIVATILFSNQMHLFAPVFGVVIGSLILFLVQLPLLFTSDFVYKPIFRITKGLKEFFRMSIPRIITVITGQIDATVDLLLTSLLGTGSYTIFYLAQHLQLLPVSVIGISIGQASLPYLSELYQEKKIDEFRKTISDSILSILFLTIPIMSFFIFARTPVVRLFFGGEKFDWDATVQTAITLSYFSLAIPFHSIYYFITRCFYAFFDSRTPFYISVLSIVINIFLSLFFIYGLKLPVWSLGLSFSISIFINVLILIFILSNKLHGLHNRILFTETFKILITTFITSFFVYEEMKILDGLIFDTTRTINVLFLLLTAGFSYLFLYIFLSWILNIREISVLKRFLLKAKAYRRRVVEIYTDIE